MRGRLGKTRRIAMVSFVTDDAASTALAALHYATVTSEGGILEPPPPNIADLHDEPLARGTTHSVIKVGLETLNPTS